MTASGENNWPSTGRTDWPLTPATPATSLATCAASRSSSTVARSPPTLPPSVSRSKRSVLGHGYRIGHLRRAGPGWTAALDAALAGMGLMAGRPEAAGAKPGPIASAGRDDSRQVPRDGIAAVHSALADISPSTVNGGGWA